HVVRGPDRGEGERPRRHPALGPAGHQGAAGKRARLRAPRRGDRAPHHPRIARRAAPAGCRAGLYGCAVLPLLCAPVANDTQARLPLLFGGISVALARMFTLIDAEVKAVHTGEWERTFSRIRLVI